MASRRNILISVVFCLAYAQYSLADQAPADVAECGEARERISQQIKEARLNGDASKRAMQEARLQSLTQRCRGVEPLQPNQQKIDHAARVATMREAQLREALGTGDQQTIDLSKRRLDQARKALEKARQ